MIDAHHRLCCEISSKMMMLLIIISSWTIPFTSGFQARFHHHPMKKPLIYASSLHATSMVPPSLSSSGTLPTTKSSAASIPSLTSTSGNSTASWSTYSTSYNPKLPTQSTGQRTKYKNIFARFSDFFYTDKETNRKYRRTVFNKYDWKQHRNSNRYFREVANMPNSLILRGLGIPTMIVTIFSWMIVLHNVLVERFALKYWSSWPVLSFPSLPFTLLSSALGLLLVFRTNVAYARWKDGRISWSMVSARSFDLMRQGLMWMSDERSKSRLVRYTVAFAKTMKWHLGHQGNDRRLNGDLAGVLTSKEIEQLLASRGRVQWTMMKIGDEIRESKLVPNLQSHIDKGVCEMTSAFFTCDRIFTTPIPLMYTRHTARFLLMWLLTTPMSLYHEFRRTEKVAIPFVIPIISFFSAIFLFGIEELGVQIEEPFSILPLANICNNIQYTGQDLLHDANISWIHADDDEDNEGASVQSPGGADNNVGIPTVKTTTPTTSTSSLITSATPVAPMPTPVSITTSASTEIGLGLGVTVLESEMTAMDKLFAQSSLLTSGGTISNVSSSDDDAAASTTTSGTGADPANSIASADAVISAILNASAGGSASASASATAILSASASASASRDQIVTLATGESNNDSHDPGDGDITTDSTTNAATSITPVSAPAPVSTSTSTPASEPVSASVPSSAPAPVSSPTSVVSSEIVSSAVRAIVDDK